MSVTGRYLLDTNILGYIASGRSPAARDTLTRTLRNGPVILSTMTEAEVLFGLERRPEAIRLRNAMITLLQSMKILPWDSAAARAYARLRLDLKATGKSLAVMDLFTAAHAIAVSATLVSHDKAFQQLTPLLTVVDWATDL